ncbi:MAG TPA: dihydrofolate reductase [Rhizomicrobium sp.]|nr:dihydrofolate reductase [Rhizomicrobium sp.]
MSVITLVVAAARNGVIGKDGAIPWRLSGDLKRFKALTLGHTVVMGRKTWDSLPVKNRPLPGRRNLVVTRDANWRAEGAQAMALEAALNSGGDIFVIGGGEIYRAALPLADRIELTEVHRDFDGDAVFTFDRSAWREVARQDHVNPDGLGYSFVTLDKK